jgi:DNA primase
MYYMNENILQNYLKKQNVSSELSKEKGIFIDQNKRIVIPVRDENGSTVFNKYRRNPEEKDSQAPKYSYDAGAKAALYNVQAISKGDTIIIAEGEFKTLCLETFGYNSISSTGGVATFKDEWIELLKEKKVYILFDTDEAGLKGAFTLNNRIPTAKIVFFAKGYGKDVNDFCSFVGKDNFRFTLDTIMNESRSWSFDLREEFKNRTALLKHITELKNISRDIANQIYDIESKSLTGIAECSHLKIYNDIIWSQINKLNKILLYFKKHKQQVTYKDDFIRAKNVPISSFIKFDSRGYARSVWNPNEKSPSMKYYAEENRVWDYSTGQGGDVVDVVMVMFGLKFKAALDKLNSL